MKKNIHTFNEADDGEQWMSEKKYKSESRAEIVAFRFRSKNSDDARFAYNKTSPSSLLVLMISHCFLITRDG